MERKTKWGNMAKGLHSNKLLVATLLQLLKKKKYNPRDSTKMVNSTIYNSMSGNWMEAFLQELRSISALGLETN